MAQQHFGESTISAALSHAINLVPDDGLKVKVDILVAKTARALTAARTINFVGYEDRELAEHSLELWNDVAPRFSAVVKEMNALVDATLELFPAAPAGPQDNTAEDDLSFDGLDSLDGSAPAAAQPQKTDEERVASLAQDFAWVLKRDIQAEMKKLREPALMQQQINLLGELEAFRDKMVGAMHAMVAAILGVFDDVEVETLYPAANERVEMAVAVRRAVAELSGVVDAQVLDLKARKVPEEDILKMLADAEQGTATVLAMPSVGCLRAAHRREMAEFRRSVARMKASPTNAVAVRQALDGFATFLVSLQAVELGELLKSHDAEVANEARALLHRASQVVDGEPGQGMLLLSHAGRRLARLAGVNSSLDGAAHELRQLAGRHVQVEDLKRVMASLETALEPVGRG